MARNKYPEETERLILDVAQRLFLDKGYEATSIQDIIDGLGGLSKGAVYHHFKSKEDIFNAVSERYNGYLLKKMQEARDAAGMTGLEKIKKTFQLSVSNGERDIIYSIAPNMMENPKLLVMQMRGSFEEAVPHYLLPMLKQGIADGSIKTDYPQELAEMLLLLTNIWLNPLVICPDVESMMRRVRLFDVMLRGMGIEMLDESLIAGYRRYCTLAKNRQK